MISREKVYELVEVFYQPTFKTFYINSVDGKTFIKSVGVFVSLGITTSMKVLEDIRDIISNTPGYNAVIAEISSKKIGNQFLNTLENTENPKQFKITDNLGKEYMNEEEARERLSELKSLLVPGQDLDTLKDIAPKVSKLQDLIDKLTGTNGWNDHLIQEEDDEFKIYHLNINYKKENDIEYRIGIYVSESN